MILKKTYLLLLALLLIVSCEKDNDEPAAKSLTIFFMNDQHGQIDNYSKVKYIIDKERQETNVIVTSGGDMFSGNPIVDYYGEKGYPMIDVMNKVGFDISVIGNHEFDYGESILSERIEQSDFDWVCANVDMSNTSITQPFEYSTVSIGDLKVTFLGLLETNGKPDDIIPSTHPLKVQNVVFVRPEDVVSQYAGIKEQESSDLYIALTHLGHNGYDGALGDFQLAQQFPYFDLIIGGHSHQYLDTVINNIPIIQAGSYLNYLGKIELTLENKKIEGYNVEFIDLSNYPEYDTDLQADINEYNNSMAEVLDEVIGFSQGYHERLQVGCFYTDALRERLEVDVTFQNYGGIRSDLDEGDITVREIYEIDPFNNGTIIFTMSVSEIKDFLMGAESWFSYSGIQIVQIDSDIEISYPNGDIIPDATFLTLGINDYIPAVNDSYFPLDRNVQSFTTAEAIIYYLKNINSVVDYPVCDNYFLYQ